jgi:hypothetical protein
MQNKIDQTRLQPNHNHDQSVPATMVPKRTAYAHDESCCVKVKRELRRTLWLAIAGIDDEGATNQRRRCGVLEHVNTAYPYPNLIHHWRRTRFWWLD